MEKTAPLEPWKTLRVSHFPTGPTTINYHSEGGPNSGGRSNRRLDHVRSYNSKRHYRDYLYMAKRWVSLWGRFVCGEIKQERVQKFVQQRAKVSPHTANKEIRFLRLSYGPQRCSENCDSENSRAQKWIDDRDLPAQRGRF